MASRELTSALQVQQAYVEWLQRHGAKSYRLEMEKARLASLKEEAAAAAEQEAYIAEANE